MDDGCLSTRHWGWSMNDLTRLANSLMALDDKLVSCMKCGFCQAFCPVFDETGEEGDVTRGKIALVENLAHLVIQDPEAVYERLSRCLLCGGCNFSCPAGAPTMEIFLEARAIVVSYLGLSPIKKAIFRTLLPNPRLFNTLMKLSSPFQGLFIKKDNSPQNTACVPMFKAFIGERHIPMLSKKTLSAKVGARDTPAGKSGLKVAFFPGCMGDKVYTDMAEACLKVFEHHGVGVYMPDNQACCGIPALTSGDLKSFGKLAAYNLDLFAQSKFDYIITPCSSCTATIKEHWQNAEGLTSAQRAFARTLVEKAMDINAFVVDVLKVTPPEGANQGKTKVTYHESCHLMKSLRVSKQPKDLIKMNKNYQLVPMKEADHCCGCGGTFTLTQPELSAKIGQRKRDNIVASGAEVVAMGCPACMMQISDMLARNHDSVKVKHTIEIYADSLS